MGKRKQHQDRHGSFGEWDEFGTELAEDNLVNQESIKELKDACHDFRGTVLTMEMRPGV